MSDAHIEVAEGSGKKLQTFANTVGGSEVHSEATTPTDSTGTPYSESNPLPVSIVSNTNFDIFTGQSTDANGDVTVVLTNTPANDASVFVLCNNARRVARFQSRSGLSLTVRVYKMRYDKATVGNTSAQNPPSGVTLASTSGQTTGSTVATNQAAQSASIAPTTGVGGNAADDATHNHTQDAHNHTMNILYQHGHTVTQTETDQPVAASESSLNFVVIYR